MNRILFLYGLNHFSSQETFTTLKSQRYSMLFTKCFIGLCFIFIYLSHLELIFLVFSEVRNQVNFFRKNTQLSKCKSYFPHCFAMSLLSNIMHTCVDLLLVYLLSLPVPYSLNYFSFHIGIHI